MLVELIHYSNTTGNMGWSRRSRESQELANNSKMDDASSNVIVQFPVLNKFGHHGPSTGCYSARPPPPIPLPWHLISVGLPLGHGSNTIAHGSPLRGLWAIIGPSIDESLLHCFQYPVWCCQNSEPTDRLPVSRWLGRSRSLCCKSLLNYCVVASY